MLGESYLLAGSGRKIERQYPFDPTARVETDEVQLEGLPDLKGS
jgi:hypothetical protein